jgi:large subunit ribosomal protein LP0
MWKPLPGLEKLLDLIEEKVGLIFTDKPIFELKPLIESNRRPADAKVGVVSQCDYFIPAGPTGMDPSQISFFHVL